MKRNKLRSFGAMVIVLAMSFTVLFAQNAFGADETVRKVTINKEVKVPANGVAVPQNITYKFRAVQRDQNENNQPKPVAKVQPITAQITSLTDGKGTVDMDFSSITVPGVYTFDLTEESPTNDANWTVGGESYTVVVLAKNDGTKSFLIKNAQGQKLQSADFINKYNKQKADLVISKKVTGDYGDKTKKFEFTITFTKDELNGELPELTTDESVEWTKVGAGKYTFKLTDAQRATIKNVPAGTKYTIEEKTADNYTKSVVVKANGTVLQSNYFVGQRENTAEFTNKYDEVTLTGVATNIAPFLALILLAVGGAVAYRTVRKRAQ